MAYPSEHMDLHRLMQCIDTYILSDPDMRENNMDSVRTSIQRTFADRTHRQRLERSRSSNWMGIPQSMALNQIPEFLNTL